MDSWTENNVEIIYKGQQYGSSGKGDCRQVRKPEVWVLFTGPHSKGETDSWKLSSDLHTQNLALVWGHTYTHTHKYTWKCNFKHSSKKPLWWFEWAMSSQARVFEHLTPSWWCFLPKFRRCGLDGRRTSLWVVILPHQGRLFIYLNDLFSTYSMLSLHVCLRPEEGTRSHSRWLWATMWLLGIELRTSGSALYHWAISPAQLIGF